MRIQWTMFNQLDDLDFADDITLLSHSHQQMQEKLTQVERRAVETGQSINTLLVVFQVSAPYKRMVFTLELNNRTLVFNEMILAFQIDPIILNAVLTLPTNAGKIDTS
jgi:hypothetical protein